MLILGVIYFVTRYLCPIYFVFLVKEGQPGIISCIAINPDQPGTYAAGSYSRGSMHFCIQFYLIYW